MEIPLRTQLDLFARCATNRDVRRRSAESDCSVAVATHRSGVHASRRTVDPEPEGGGLWVFLVALETCQAAAHARRFDC
jgi:hypothetical protein